MEPLLVILGTFVFLGFIAMPFMLMSLLGRTSDMEEKLNKVADALRELNQRERAKGVPSAPEARPEPVAASPTAVAQTSKPPVAVPVPSPEPPPLPAAAVRFEVATPVAKPLPPQPLPTPVESGPDPFVVRLRELGLLPPAELEGEYAVGSWWAVRVGGVLALAAVIFLGIWLNLRSQLSPIFRLAELLAIGVGIYWGGTRIERTRPDLGRVIAAAGLGMLQFAAWATYGLEKMRVVDSPAQAAGFQFVVALGAVFAALVRRDRLFAQLSVIFATVSVLLSLRAGAEPAVTAAGAALIAVIGGVLLFRGGWLSTGVLGLMGSQLCLLLLREEVGAVRDYSTFALLGGAFVSFVALWLSERKVTDDSVFGDLRTRVVFLLGAFLAPASVALLSAWAGGAHDRAIVAFALALLSAGVAWVERVRLPAASEILYVAAVALVGAGSVWLADPHLVWLVWLLAAAFAQLLVSRFRSEWLRWLAEAFSMAAGISFLQAPPHDDWINLLAVAGFGLLLNYREDWERPQPWQIIRRWVGIVGLALVTLCVQEELLRTDTAWPWVVLAVILLFRFRPALLWAASPSFLVSHCVLILWGQIDPAPGAGWPVLWALLTAGIDAYAILRLKERAEPWVNPLQCALAVLVGLLAVAAAHHAAEWLLPAMSVPGLRLGWIQAVTWAVGAALVSGAAYELARRDASRETLPFLSLSFLLAYLLQVDFDAADVVAFPATPLWLIGLGCALHGLAAHTRMDTPAGTWLRSIFGTLLLLVTFGAVRTQEGALVSLLWALASVLAFVVGHWQGTRALRMIGLSGLVIATIRVIAHDIRDLPGRVAACAVVALAFLVVGWLYGRMSKPEAK